MKATILPLGDQAVLVRFGATLSDEANRAAIGFAAKVVGARIGGVTEVVPSLVSVQVSYNPGKIGFAALCGELRLLLWALEPERAIAGAEHTIKVRFGGEAGPDLPEVAGLLGLDAEALVSRHCAAALRVLATGFAPGFVYCGFHPPELVLPRRTAVRPRVEPGSILFAAGQTAIAATSIPTGWHVIGRTEFANFDPWRTPPTRLQAGDLVRFEAVP